MVHDPNTNSTPTDPFFDSTASLLAVGRNAVDDANSLVSWQRDAFQSDPFAALARDVRRPMDGEADWTDASIYAQSPADGGTVSFDLSAVLPPVAPMQPRVSASVGPQIHAVQIHAVQMQQQMHQPQPVQPLTVGRPPAGMPIAPQPLMSQQIASGRPIPSAVAISSLLAQDFALASSPLATQQTLVAASLPTPFALCAGSPDPVVTSTPRSARRHSRNLDPLVVAYHKGVNRERRNAAASRLTMYLLLVGMAAALYAGYVAFIR